MLQIDLSVSDRFLLLMKREVIADPNEIVEEVSGRRSHGVLVLSISRSVSGKGQQLRHDACHKSTGQRGL